MKDHMDNNYINTVSGSVSLWLLDQNVQLELEICNITPATSSCFVSQSVKLLAKFTSELIIPSHTCRCSCFEHITSHHD